MTPTERHASHVIDRAFVRDDTGIGIGEPKRCKFCPVYLMSEVSQQAGKCSRCRQREEQA